MQQSIIVAGNGPSLAKIDYARLPRGFDVFRCNQFYFEDKYFLGKKIKGAFFNPQVLKEQYFTLKCLRDRKEYEVEDVYCNIFSSHLERDLLKIFL
ncbi:MULTISPECIES: alpha-2,3-sialyltransferase [unclassified Helicobacter]|uniref:alpha-2,3-sialyltransferase n=1 Tax=unclassified Helicobacter TaxID=2593540 RepID=UPI000CF139F2|nr:MULTISPECIES: alpha-2,3-sialyltransferase [unclassified Helicobacter]